MKIYERSLQALISSAPRTHVLAKLASLAQIGELARRLGESRQAWWHTVVKRLRVLRGDRYVVNEKSYTHEATSSCGQCQGNFLCISRKFTGDE